MLETKQQRSTRQIEMVETHNIATSLHRLRNAPAGYDGDRVKRVLYHAIAMKGGLTNAELGNIRVAMGLP